MSWAYFNTGGKQRAARSKWLRERTEGLKPTGIERDVLVRAQAQGGRVCPTGLNSATTEIVIDQLKRKGYVTIGLCNNPLITDAGVAIVEATRGKELPDH